ncbi:oligoribonuclease, partial [Candidatus Saccharibacteria bacterium CG_4_9_14_0_2_um_filter_41_9]
MVKKITKNRILWLDLEMSGLSATDDLILEIAVIVTDWDFNEISTYQGVVKNKKAQLAQRFA